VPHLSALARLLSSLAVLEQRDGKLNMSSLAAVSAAQKLGGSVTGIVAGSGTKAVAEQAAKVKGIEKIIYIENGAYDRVCEQWRVQLHYDICSCNGRIWRPVLPGDHRETDISA
jgi:electron transfer flavoprotein alpha subunit